ncbi:MAG: pantetheine-phosphate adenylyltransferase [Flavobacteriales bacterium]|nr:pantetheine-phosphate adenylyltransferase [Flavobacteriales bacterium]|tara:strand:+ start:2724 stop:3188 length:465 start_codon:yes stop_codon:yes gene_type:complete
MKKIAVFAGSFDPFTLGHEEVIKKTLPLFDKIIIGVGNNINKKYLFSKEKRTNWIKRIYINNKKIEVKKFKGLTVNFCKREKASYILRGLRNNNDLIFEKQIQETNDILNYNIKTIYIISSSKTSHISSTIIRDLIQNKGKLNGLIPDEIIKDI